MDDLSPELLARAGAHGLCRVTYRAASWLRAGHATNLVGRADAGWWWWAPEGWAYHEVVSSAARFTSEAEALAAALDWLDAGEPGQRRGVTHDAGVAP